MERNDARCAHKLKTGWRHSVEHPTNVDICWRMMIDGWNHRIDHPDAPGRERLFQHGQGDNNILFVGETSCRLQEKSSLKLILIRQLFNMKMRETDLTNSHINTFGRVLSELSSQGTNFKDEVKALALLSSLSASWEVFCTTFTKSCPKLNLDETIKQVLPEDIRRISMGLTIDDSAKAHYSTELIGLSNPPREQAERTGQNTNQSRRKEDQQQVKSRNRKCLLHTV